MSIIASNINKSFGKIQVLKDVNIECKAGEICGLLGANGAGRTTLFKIILGLVSPDSGSVTIKGEGRKKIGAIIEGPALYEYLSAYENLTVFSSIQKIPYDKATIHRALQQVGLPIDRKDPVRNFSLGMKQRLGIAIALLNNPPCLILDEPFSGLDPMGVASLRNLIVQLANVQQLAIILSSHIIEELSKICNTLYVIKDGKIVTNGSAQELITHNTDTYTICAHNIQHAKALEKYPHSFNGSCVQVHIKTAQVAELISALQQEQIFINTCTPEINMQKLFKIADA